MVLSRLLYCLAVSNLIEWQKEETSAAKITKRDISTECLKQSTACDAEISISFLGFTPLRNIHCIHSSLVCTESTS